MRNFVGKAGRALGFGLLFFGLRTVQLCSGFDHATGLALSPAAGTALAVMIVQKRRHPHGKDALFVTKQMALAAVPEEAESPEEERSTDNDTI